MRQVLDRLGIVFLCLSAVFLVGLQMKAIGWVIVLIGLLITFLSSAKFRKYLIVLYPCIIFMGLTPISTDIGYLHVIQMSVPGILGLLFPFVVSRYIYKDRVITYPFHHGRRWYKTEIAYILLTALVAYFLIPFYLKNTGSYHNWTVQPQWDYLVRLFIGTNALGIWDELFFINTTLGVLQYLVRFRWANIAQGFIFTSFLYELGFRGWGFIMIYIFALIQGVVLKKTHSLLYVITSHLTVDLILFLSLLHLYNPAWFPIFVT